MGKLVIDTSVAIKWFVNEKGSQKAIQILESLEKDIVELHSLNYLRIEMLSVLRKYVLKRYLDRKKAQKIFNLFSELPLIYHNESKQLLMKAFDQSLQKNISFYDALFVALASDINGKLVTADRKLANALDNDELIYFIG